MAAKSSNIPSSFHAHAARVGTASGEGAVNPSPISFRAWPSLGLIGLVGVLMAVGLYLAIDLIVTAARPSGPAQITEVIDIPGGQLEVDSVPRHGTELRARLPLVSLPTKEPYIERRSVLR